MIRLEPLQIAAAHAIVSVFETSRVSGGYDNVTVIRGDTGHLTYGRFQTTLSSGNLYLLIKRYCDEPGAAYADELRPYLSRLSRGDVALDHDEALKRTLRDAGHDPVMQATQDLFFDETFWAPALLRADATNLNTPLGVAVVFDSKVHGSWDLIKSRTETKTPRASVDEQEWISTYVETRDEWLRNHRRLDLRPTVYRMEEFRKLIDRQSWLLPLPFSVRGKLISEETLAGQPAHRVSAESEEDRILALTDPPTRGSRVRQLQELLNQKLRAGLLVDGVFGSKTADAVREFQRREGLTPDGIVGPLTMARIAG